MKLAKQPLLVIFMLTAILWGSSLFPALAQAAEEELPHFYDLRLAVPEDRDSGYDPAKARINAIRNQGIYGTCWAFSAIAAVESNVYTQLQKAGIPYNVQTKPYDLSEWYLAWISAAAPTEVEEDSVYHSRPPEVHNYYRPFAMKVYQGGFPFREVEVMMANGTGLIWEQGETVKNIVAPKKYLPPVLQLKNILMVPEGKAANRAMIKQMIKEYGAISFALNCDPMRKNTFATAFYGSKAGPVNHGIDVIGWDDDFVFTAKNMKDAVIPKQKGAWIIRNSWGDGWGENGYAYLSYADKTSMMFTAFEMNLDKGSVSYISTHERNGQLASGDFANDIEATVPTGSAFGAGYTGRDDAFLTGMGFFAWADGMAYTIEVRRGQRTEAMAGKLVYRQQGIFGEDGTSKLMGYRIVPFKQAVYIPQGEKYTVTVALTNPHGKTVYLLSPSEVETAGLQDVDDWIRLGEKGSWQRVLQPGQKGLPVEFQKGSVKQRLYFKKTDEPLGKEFTVTSLQDDSQTAIIDLGRRGELYGQDLLAPQRETLSQMHVNTMDEDCFSGTITGEGSVIKEGAGTLTLTGQNTYTGVTCVQEGTLLLAADVNGKQGELAGDVLLAGGRFGGNGKVQGNLHGKGTLLLNAAGTLTVAGKADLTGMEISVTEKAAAGKVLLQAGQGIDIAGNFPLSVRLSDDGKRLIYSTFPPRK